MVRMIARTHISMASRNPRIKLTLIELCGRILQVGRQSPDHELVKVGDEGLGRGIPFRVSLRKRGWLGEGSAQHLKVAG